MNDGAPLPAARPALLDPITGEVLELVEPAELARFRDRLGDLKRLIDATLVEVDERLVAELDRANVRSTRFGEWHVKAPAPFETVWDVPALGIVLEALVQGGKITRAAAEAALVRQPPPPPKPAAVPLKNLLGHADPDVVEAIDACRHAEPARRRATVNRAAPAQRRLRGAQGPREGNE